ncbi:hypothetical protein BEL04_08300 [Mucilaginibacter sp. PPCGB 2223]|uniref:hypothetical protein n=1 Tax=Mucilaginibacter sp. PPCGB 2223 TaxID=1886027 RepID=UPI000826B27A|nr:hypothetical protein [Mucilaginibacter sp. PPCGB 2223]OCX54248.1 hypothetical protein BEL04_08300 [Mucilaginibacter sp. PPCGB 2223]
MPDQGPILDSYIDSIIKANGASNPDPTKTQGADLRELIKAMRDHLEAEISNTSTLVGLETGAREAGDMDLQNQIQQILPPPAYRTPSETLSSTQTTAGLEIGQTLSIALSSAFNQGDSGGAVSVTLSKNGSVIASGTTENPFTHTDSGQTIGAAAITYQSTRYYSQGPVLDNPITHTPDSRGQIGSGSAASDPLVFQGYYFIGFGAAAAQPADTAAVRALPQHQLSSGSKVLNLNCGTQYTSQYVVLPPGKSIISAVDADAGFIPVSYSQVASLSFNDLSNTPISGYTIWARTQGVPYSQTHIHQITIN